MDLIKYIILGIIQGLTEPLPISSSGHLQIFKELFNTNMFNDLNFETVVNFGSFIAIFFIFRKDIFKLINSFFTFIFNKESRKLTKNDYKYCWLIVISSIPVGIAGFLIKDYLESFMSIKLVGLSLLITATMLFIVRKISGNKTDQEITYKDAIIIGLIQMVALMPGISRSGAVLIGCILCGLNRDTSLKYTFMLFFPVSVAAMGLGTYDLMTTANSSIFLPYLLGMIASTIVTYFSYLWLSKIVKNGNLWKFSIYCAIIGIWVLYYFR